ncbi:uncharacterized protein LOC142563068 isoform X2 [Dermacentor variabilis]|uniref:uncharacterized protein LOC142563068 isoform X2 n=1 Tax=Dermacentor variabilis TaxID=34621 RepID=UPI003F5BC688
MVFLAPIAIFLGVLAGVATSAWHASPAFTTIYSPTTATVSPKQNCYTLWYEWGSGWRYKFYPEGTPCWLTWMRNSVGYCSRGRCNANYQPTLRHCVEQYEGEGYPTNCNVTTCNGTPCVHVSNKPRSVIAGLCLNSVCVPSYDLGKLLQFSHSLYERNIQYQFGSCIHNNKYLEIQEIFTRRQV